MDRDPERAPTIALDPVEQPGNASRFFQGTPFQVTEALITDLQINAPHIKCSVVMPGPIGTSIRANTRKIHSGDRESDAIDAAGLAQARERFALLGRDVSQLSDDQLRNLVAELERRFRDKALTSAAQAATIILDGVKALNGTIAGVVLVHAAHGLVIAVWIAAAAFAAVDGELEFAARNLGASPLRTALTVTLPLAAPGLMAAAIFVFLESLDEFTGTYFVGVPDVTTLPLIMFTASLAGNLMIAFGRSRAGGTASPDRSRSSKACRKRCQAVTGEIPQGRGTTLSHLPSEVGISTARLGLRPSSSIIVVPRIEVAYFVNAETNKRA